jgi:hypothetical protein
MKTQYRMVCRCRDVCSINGFGIRINSRGNVHYQCKEELPELSKYLPNETNRSENSGTGEDLHREMDARE